MDALFSLRWTQILITLGALTVFGAVSCPTVFAEYQHTASEVDRLITEAIENNPELNAFRQRIHSLEQRPSQARALDDPMLRLGVANLPVDSFRFDQEAMTQKQIQVMQKFPFPGTLDLKGEIAEKDLAVSRTDYEEKKNALIRRVRVSHNNLLFLDRALAITRDSRDLLAEVITTAETRYAAGQGAQREIVKARIELSGIIQKMLLLQQQRETAAAQLNTLLNRPVENGFDANGELHQTPLALNLQELKTIAEDTRPLLIGLKEKVEQSRLSVDLAELEYYPGMDVGLTYGQRDDAELADRPDFFSASVTFNIPLWYKTKESRKVAEKRSDLRMAEEQYTSARNSIHFRLAELRSLLEMKTSEIELFTSGLLPQGTASYESALSGYRVNKVDFLTLINSLIALYNYKIQHYRALTDHESSLAELEETVGRRLF